MPSPDTEPAPFGRVHHRGRPKSHCFRGRRGAHGASAMGGASTNRSARRNSCLHLGAGHRSEIGLGPRKGIAHRSHSCPEKHPALRQEALPLQQAAGRRQGTWLAPLRRPTCPTIQQRPGWGSGSSRHDLPSRHRQGTIRSRGALPITAPPSALHGALPRQALTHQHPHSHKLHFINGVRLRFPSPGIFAGRGVDPGISASLLHRSSSRPAG